MIFRFRSFELDEGKRELRLRGRPLEMQPRVFDVLVYLVRNRERVVTKDELLSAIWPEVIVTDSSIMRAVSVIRAMLRDGGQSDAIQTFSRHGYRFMGELDDAPPRTSNDHQVARALAACERGDWVQALSAFEKVQHADKLHARDLEKWAHAALYVGEPNEAIYPLERAVAAYIQAADRVGAARAALTLTNVNLEGRALPIAKGWHRRAGAFLCGETTETREHGLHLWLTARIALFDGDLSVCLDHAKRAEALARRLEDADLEALGLVYRAHIELATGEIRSGLVHMDEAGAATLAGTVSPWTCGFVFCSVIWAYLDRGDLHRAGQWSDQFVRWSERYASFGYPGLCRLHRGEVMCAQGKLTAAESEVLKARVLLAKSARYAEGDACRVLGEIRLLRGDSDGADEAFRQARELGWHPLPGWALVQVEHGQYAAAIKSLQRGLQFPGWADGQRRGILLAHLARVAALAGNLKLAKQTFAELKASADLRNTSGCEGVFHWARAELAVAEKNHEEAIGALRDASTIWSEAGFHINAAHTRFRLAEILAAAGDVAESEIELAAAEKAFAQMEAHPMVTRCRAARKATLSLRRAAL
jgi:DNA-binding winged helix-turn-helix (wHTH) protein